MTPASPLFMIGINRRSRTEIIVSIIDIAQKGKTLTDIINKAHLSSKQAKQYLVELDKLGFIEIRDVSGKKVYITSERGNEFLKQYNVLRKFFQ